MPGRYTRFSRLLALRDRLADLFARRPRPAPSAHLGVEALEDRVVPTGRPLPHPMIFVGTGDGPPPLARAFNAVTGELVFERLVAEPGFGGGVRVANADLTGDGFPDLIAALGPGGQPVVQVLDGKTGNPIPGPLARFLAYDPGFAGGVEVAAADVDGDGTADVVTAAGAGGGPHVRVFSGRTGAEVRSFYAYEPDFAGGVNIAAADFTRDGRADLAVGAGPGGGPRVRVFDMATGEQAPGPLGNFFAADPGFRGGVTVGADWKGGDVDDDGTPDLVVGTGPGAPGGVTVYSGATGAVLGAFAPFGPGMTAGVRAALAFVDDDRHADVVAGTGPGVPAQVRVFAGATGRPVALPTAVFFPFGPGALGGVSLAATNDPVVPYMGSPFALPNGAPAGTAVTYTVTLSGTVDGQPVVPTGEVVFTATDAAGTVYALGTGAVAADTQSPGGGHARAAVTSAALPAGTFTLTAAYSGDGTFVGQTTTGSTTVAAGGTGGGTGGSGGTGGGTTGGGGGGKSPPPPPPPVVRAYPILTYAAEAGGTAYFHLWRTGDLTHPLSAAVEYSGAAEWGVDYTAPLGAYFPAGQAMSAAIPLTGLPDDLAEGDEAVVLTVVAGAGYEVGPPASATGWVVDDDGGSSPPPPPANHPPTAGDGAGSGHAGEPVTGTVAFSDPDGEALVVAAGGATHGAVAVGPDGGWVYTPSADPFFGTDAFTYTVTDPHGASATGTVTVTLTNAPPTAPDGSGSGHAGTAVRGAVTVTDPDGHDAPPAVGVTTAPAYGSVLMGPDGAWTYAPHSAVFVGTDTFTYTATDRHGATATGTVTVTLTNTPPTTADASGTAHAGTPVAGAVGFSDPDPEDVFLTRGLAAGPAHGTATFGWDGAWVYTPASPAFVGTDEFTYWVSDGIATSVGTITVTLTNTPPTAGGATKSGHVGETLSGRMDFSDPDDGPLVPTVTSWPAHGWLYLSASGDWTYVPTDPTWVGTDAFTFAVDDGHDGGTASATVTLTLGNEFPVAPDGSATGHAGTALAGRVEPSDPDDHDNPVVPVLATAPAHGTATLSAFGDWTYTPWSVLFVGTDAFTYTVTDPHGAATTGTVTVELTNAPPTAPDGAGSGHAGTTLTGTVGVSDPDPEDTHLTVFLLTPAAHGAAAIGTDGAWTYTPGSPTFVGTDSFTYAVDDGHGGTASGTITVTPTNAAPTAGGATTTMHAGTTAAGVVAFSDPDSDDNPLAPEVTTPAVHGVATLGADGAWTYTPSSPQFVGTDAFTYTVRDPHGGVATGTITVTVEDAPPVAPAVALSARPFRPAAGTLPYSDPDPDDAPLAVTVGSAAHGTVTLGADGTFTYTAADRFWGGTDSFTYTVTDPHGVSATGAVTVTVVPWPELVVAVTAAPLPLRPGDEATLTATAAGGTGTGYAYVWTLEGATEPVAGPVATRAFPAPGVYSAAVWVTDDLGYVGEGRVDVPVKDVVTVTAAGPAAEGSAAPAGFTFARLGSTGDLTAAFTVSGTARWEGGEDYDSVGVAVTIPDGATSVFVPVRAAADNRVEGTETVVVALADGGDYYEVGGTGVATVEVADDPPVVTVAWAADAAEAGPAAGAFTVSRTGGKLSEPLTVSFALSGTAAAGADYQAVGHSVTIPAGAGGATVAVAPRADNAVEGTESVTLTLADGSSRYVVGGTGTATLFVADDPPVVTVTAARGEREGAAPGNTFRFTRAGGDVGEALSVGFTVGGTATPGADYDALPTAVTIPAGAADAYLSVRPRADDFVEGTETVVVTLTDGGSHYLVGGTGTASATVADDPPVVTVAAAGSPAEAGPAYGTFVFTRAGGAAGEALSVGFTVGGTAASGADYDALPTTVTIPAGARTASVSVRPWRDNLVEGAETVVVTLADGGTHYQVGGAGAATTAIADDPPVVTVTAAGNPAEAGPVGGTFTFTRAGGDLASALTVHYAVGGTATPGDDYTPLAGVVTFPAGEAAVAVALEVLTDALVEGVETVTLAVAPDGATYTAGVPPAAALDVADDAPMVTISASGLPAELDPETGEPTSGFFTFTRAGGDLSLPLDVGYTVGGTAVPGLHFDPLPGVVTIPAGLDHAAVPFRPRAGGGGGNVVLAVAVVGGAGVQPWMPAGVPAGAPAAGARFLVGFPRVAGLAIAHGPPEQILLVTTSGTAAERDPTTGAPAAGTFTVTRVGGDQSQNLTVAYSVVGLATPGVDYEALSGVVVIPAGAASAVVTVVPLPDNEVERAEVVAISLLGYPAMNALWIADDPPLVTVTAAGDPAEAGLPGGTFTFTRTGGKLSEPLTVGYAVGGTAVPGADYDPLPGVVTILAGHAAAAVALAPRPDNRVEGGETVRVVLSGQTAAYRPEVPWAATLTISDAPPVVAITPGVRHVAAGATAALRVTRAGGDPSQALTAALALEPGAAGDDPAVWDADFRIVGHGDARGRVSFDKTGGTVTFRPGETEVVLDLTTEQGLVSADDYDWRGVRVAVRPGGAGYQAGPGAADVRIAPRPVPVKKVMTVAPGQTTSITLSALAPAGVTLGYTLFGPHGPELTLDGTTATFHPDPEFVGSYTFYYQAHGTLPGVTPGTTGATLDSNLGVVRVHVVPAPAVDPPEPPLPPLPPPNEPPTAALAAAWTWVHAGETATLTAAAADPNGAGDVVAVEWDFNYDGTTFVPHPDAAGPTASHTYLTPGIYYVAVRVTDAAGEEAVDWARVHVMLPDDPTPNGWVPKPPVTPPDYEPVEEPPGDTGGGGAGPAPAEIWNDGTGTFTVGGSRVFSVLARADDWVTWDFDYDGTHFVTAGYGSRIGHTFVAPGEYRVAASVVDADGNETVVTTTVRVEDRPALVIFLPVDQYGVEGQTFQFAPPVWVLDLHGQPDEPAAVDFSGIGWAWEYSGPDAFTIDPATVGDPSPTHQFTAGRHVVVVRLADDGENIGYALANITVDEVSPVAEAGPDVTAQVGTPITFTGTASDFSGIRAVEWDFGYTGREFTPAANTLVATHTFIKPGVYQVAFRARDNTWATTIDTVTVTITDAPPSGAVALASSEPGREGVAVGFRVTGVAYPDPDVSPSVWADWTGTGTFALVPPEEWRAVTTAADGSKSFFLSHTYPDSGTYPARFRVSDPEGAYTASSVSVVVENVRPTIHPVPFVSFRLGDPIAFSLGTATDPSPADAAAGFTYSFRVNGGTWVAQTSPNFVIESPRPGTTYVVEGYAQDQDGGRSDSFGRAYVVPSDQVFRFSGTGRVRLDWTDEAGGAGEKELAGDQTYRFPREITALTVTLLSSNATYNLATNYSIRSVDGQGVTGVDVTVRTDQHILPSVYGDGDPRGTPFVKDSKDGPDGNVGTVWIGANSFVSVYSRGDLGSILGLVHPTTVPVVECVNLTGLVSVANAGRITASGAVNSLIIPLGLDRLTAASVREMNTGSAAPAGRQLVVTLREGGQGTTQNGSQLANRSLYYLDAAGRVTYFQNGPSGDRRYASFRYDAAGRLVGATDAHGPWTFGVENGQTVVLTRPPGLPPGGAPGDGSAPPPPDHKASWGWADHVYDASVTVRTAVADGAVYLRETAFPALQALAQRTWTRAGETIAWAADGVQSAIGTVTLTIGNVTETITSIGRDAAERFVNRLGELGGSFGQLVAKVREFGTGYATILSAIVRNPDTFLSNVLGSIKTGVERFFNGLPTTFPQKLIEWLGDIKVGAPAAFTAPAVAEWLLKAFKLDWNGVQEILVNAVGPGNVALLAQGYELLRQVWERTDNLDDLLRAVNTLLAQAAGPGVNPDRLDAESLMTLGVDALKELVLAEIARRAPPVILAKLSPAGAVLTTIYQGVTWLVDNAARLGKLFDAAGGVVGTIRDLAGIDAQSNPAAAAAAGRALTEAVEKAMVAGMIPALSFAASQLGLGNLPDRVRETLDRIQTAPRRKVEAAVRAVVNRAKGPLGLNGPHAAQYQGLLVPAVEFRVGNERHRLWVVNPAQGKSGLIAASVPDLIGDVSALVRHFHEVTRDARNDPRGRIPNAVGAVTAAANRLIAANQQVTASRTEATLANLQTAYRGARAAVDELAAALVEIDNYNRSRTAAIRLPDSTPLSTTNLQELANSLQRYTVSGTGYGVLVVNGREYRLATGTPILPRVWIDSAGFTQNNWDHLEASAAAVLRRLRYDGVDVTTAFLVVNRPFICDQAGVGCQQNLARMLPLGVELTVHPAHPDRGPNANTTLLVLRNRQVFVGA